MSLIYILLAISLVIMESSIKFDTRNIGEKVGAGLMFFGAIISLVHVNYLIQIGASIYFGIKVIKGFIVKYNRRSTDKRGK